MPKPQIARVGVDDERWMAFRQAALSRGISVSAYLARLVEVRASIDELDDLAGRLARSAVAHGADWSDVASSLRLRREQARRAYGARPS